VPPGQGSNEGNIHLGLAKGFYETGNSRIRNNSLIAFCKLLINKSGCITIFIELFDDGFMFI
jgi:hypothetical protein